ncbi:hypothetical protein EMCRGX_G027584 [Ephydatia muelleri]
METIQCSHCLQAAGNVVLRLFVFPDLKLLRHGPPCALLQITGTVPKPRRAVLCRLKDPLKGDTIDHGLVLWFPGPHSFTGEDCVEFQVHGGPSVVASLLGALGGLLGLRPAEPGDFAKRAFFNGKLDLTAVEGLADLIHAETEAQRKQALRQMEGDLGRLYDKWRADLVRLVAHVEAVIDFGEDENIEDGILDEVKLKVQDLHRAVMEHLSDGRRGERLRAGVHVAIVGAPNVGKSSLLNILCQRPAAIVSPHAGTTRDVLESALDICGYPVILSDMAGLRLAEDPVEQEGVRRALIRATTADLKVLIGDVSELSWGLDNFNPHPLSEFVAKLVKLSPSALQSDEVRRALDSFSHDNTIVVLNKVDLLSQPSPAMDDTSLCWVSCLTGDGITQLTKAMKHHLERLCGSPEVGGPSITQARHRTHLSKCADSLDQFLACVEDERSVELAAEELRVAIGHLGRITGKVGIEEILDVIFKDFCIGK